MSDSEPRFAAKHRRLFQGGCDVVGVLKPLFIRHIFLGYCFLEYLMESFNGSPLPRDVIAKSPEKLFVQWVPMLYSSFGAASFDREMEKRYGSEAAYVRVKNFWMTTTVRPIFGTFGDIGLVPDDQDKLMLMRFFDAGISLRLLESRPLSEDELGDVATGGVYSADKATTAKATKQKAGGSGCAVLIVALGVLAWAAVSVLT